jgi:hypothetical protein
VNPLGASAASAAKTSRVWKRSFIVVGELFVA